MAARRLALDTSAYVHLRSGHKAAGELVLAADVVLVPSVVLGELRSAFRRGSRERDNLARLDEFLGQAFVHVVSADADVARRYGELHARLLRSGTPIPTNDVWIAATALHAGAHVVTFDTDFERVTEIDCTVLRT